VIRGGSVTATFIHTHAEVRQAGPIGRLRKQFKDLVNGGLHECLSFRRKTLMESEVNAPHGDERS
jgi:hypothetical protein